MAHPLMFDADDPLLHRIRALCLALPRAAEKISHGRPTFYTTKVFAYYGASIKVDGVYVQHPRSFVVHPDEGEVLALAEEARCYRPAYLGPSGWIGVDLAADTDWEEVRELIEASYRETASARLVAELDAR
ncbi:MmcQ/YjbR family DNA-binding protein [Raineyella sp. W15-4]|uniref:MmcQ/YjbR family DNA-binding protein n=1 Tax=Raineyella sp. W15-4 TaxID=3081651 RepID=UPI0029541AA0|nr:MmcQ/YjbR family DNA-binding protein [Raineyella sp. W15-4]WOQ16492.1 MmcQ/YjbR family DNA-binding protein [Raineyella sp. W15-4]